MKQLTDNQLINLLSVGLGITLSLFITMLLYFRNEVQYLVEQLNKSFKREQDTLTEWYEKYKKANDDSIILLKEKQDLIHTCDILKENNQLNIDYWKNRLKEHFNKNIILNDQSKRYSIMCRKLYDENQNLKLEIQGVESLFIDMKNKANEFELKITELESKKLKERKKK